MRTKTIVLSIILLASQVQAIALGFSKNLENVPLELSQLQKIFPLETTDQKNYQAEIPEGKIKVEKRKDEPPKVVLNPKDQKLVEPLSREKLELIYQSPTRDTPSKNFILGNPEKGRLYYFRFPEKLEKIEWVKPWKNKKELQNLKKHISKIASPPATKQVNE